MIRFPHMNSNQTEQTHDGWLRVGEQGDPSLENALANAVKAWVEDGAMPPNEPERVAGISTAIASQSFTTSPQRLEMLRSLCQIYSAGVRAGKITSHRPIIGPCIVLVKRILFRSVAALLGPSFERQREFNAGVIRLLGDLCNEDRPHADRRP
ncbi:MAG: hypothetical protein RL326_1805 [Pseudomonadota bacterium]